MTGAGEDSRRATLAVTFRYRKACSRQRSAMPAVHGAALAQNRGAHVRSILGHDYVLARRGNWTMHLSSKGSK